MKKACASNCRDPENRSKKNCVCGAHSLKDKNAKRDKIQRGFSFAKSIAYMDHPGGPLDPWCEVEEGNKGEAFEEMWNSKRG